MSELSENLKKINRKRQLDGEEVDVRKRDDRRETFVTGDELVTILTEVLALLIDRGDTETSSAVANELISLLKGKTCQQHK